MLVVGALASVGLWGVGSFRERTLRAEADAAWQELSMAVNLYRIASGDWPQKYMHAHKLGQLTQPWGALEVNLAPSNYPDEDRRSEQDMKGSPDTGGPTPEEPSGHLILDDGEVCVWYERVASVLNDESCP